MKSVTEPAIFFQHFTKPGKAISIREVLAPPFSIQSLIVTIIKTRSLARRRAPGLFDQISLEEEAKRGQRWG
jgi:hypothetical protein